MPKAIPTARPEIDVLCVGEAMSLVVPAEPQPLETATDFRIEVAGAESNVASHLARSGHRVAWFSAVGGDALGRRALAAIRGYGVDVSLVRIDPDAPTGLLVKDPSAGVNYYRSGSAASRLSPADLTDIEWRRIRVLHISGINMALSNSHRDMTITAVEAAHDAGNLVSFDVNYRPQLWSLPAAPVLLDLASRCDICFVGRDEAQELWGTCNAQDVRALLPEPLHVIVKDGDVEATEFQPASAPVAVPALRVEVAEPVGAGDAFAAGWLGAFLTGLPAAERLAAGHRLASSVLMSTSDVPR